MVAIEAGLSLGADDRLYRVGHRRVPHSLQPLQLMLDNAAIGFVLLAALAVNLRMAMYSASALVPLPIGQRAAVAACVLISYLNFDQKLCRPPSRNTRPSLTCLLQARGAVFSRRIERDCAVCGSAASIVGALIGTAIPDALALDFILPIAFLSLVAPMLRTLAHVAAALVSVVVVSLLLIGLPSGSGLLIAAVCAMAAGVIVETWMKRDRA